MSDDPRRQACDDLARLLASEEGLRAARLRQLLDHLAPRAERLPPAARPAPSPAKPKPARSRPLTPAPIGPWLPEPRGGRLVWVRGTPSGLGDPWPPQELLEAKAPGGPFRIVFLGESAAAGWFYAPQLTPARVLQEQLALLAGADAFEVINLAKVDLTAGELMGLATAAIQLQPDLLVVFAGNNWPLRYRSHPPPGFVGSLEAAAAFRADGMRGLARLADESALRSGEEALRRIAAVTAEAGMAVVVVVPEVNLADWERARPPVWLAGSDSRQWHAAHSEVARLLAEARFAEAVEHAQRMIDLDQGLCATSHRLLARALVGLGRDQDAARAARAEVDARAWDNSPQMPGVTSSVQSLLRRASQEHGFQVVELASVFAAQAGTPLPGSRLFLDYCHLSLQGMKVAMAAVAAEVLALGPQPPAIGWREVLARVPDPQVPAELEARAQLMTALYNAHWASPADGSAPAIGGWLEAALGGWEGGPALVEGYARTRSAPAETLLLSAEQQRMFAEPGRAEHHIWSAETLDPDTLRAAGRALAAPGSPDLDFGAWLTPSHAVETRGRLDLLRNVYHWRLTDQPRASSAATDNPLAFYAALWPESRFCLISEAAGDLELQLLARLPTPGPIRREPVLLALNGVEVERVELASRWTPECLLLPQALLRPGINELALRWPPPPAEGDRALARVGERLDVRIGVELHPVFGEIATLSVQVRHHGPPDHGRAKDG